MAANHKNLHIVFFPWLAFGHFIPYLELAKLIAQKGHRVSFISTPNNIQRLPKIPPHLSTFLSFVQIPLPRLDNLPLHAEATTDVPYDQVQFLKQAYDNLKQPLIHFLKSSNADWILHDFVPFWIGRDIGPELGIRTAFFSIFSPECLAIIGPSFGDSRTKPEDFTVPPQWVPFPTTVAFRRFEIMRIFDVMIANITGVSDLDRFKMSAHFSDVVVVRGGPEFSSDWIRLLRDDVYAKPIYPVGQLPKSEYDSGDENPAWLSIKAWLDEQRRGLVVYVAFGSEAKPSQQELTEIALGLEKSDLPFYWVLRTQRGPSDPDPIELPDGFEERTKGRGVVCTTWAPQLKILEHESVGGFLTHSGWSSVVEAMQFGRGLILLTFLAEQGINARVLEEKKMGYSIPRNEADGSFTRDSVAESLKLVMVKEEGKIYRESIKEMKDLFVNRERDEGLIDEFLDYLKTKRNEGEHC